MHIYVLPLRAARWTGPRASLSLDARRTVSCIETCKRPVKICKKLKMHDEKIWSGGFTVCKTRLRFCFEGARLSSRAVSAENQPWLHSSLKNSWILSGAAFQRCDKAFRFCQGFSPRGT